MTFDDDFVRLNFTIGTQMVPLVKLGLEWPPPDQLYLGVPGDKVSEMRPAEDDDDPTYIMRLVHRSEISDDARAAMTHVCRSAEYEYEASGVAS